MEIHKYCRVCTGRNPEMLSIFEDYKYSECNLRIFEVITKCASVQIEKLDGFSERICKGCAELLRQAFSFKRLSEESDYKFRHNLIGARKIEACEANKIQCDKVDENQELNNIFIEVKAEIESEFYEEDTNIQYGILHEASNDLTILQNSPSSNKELQTGQFNINLDRNNEQSNRKINDATIKVKSEFCEEETNAEYEVLDETPLSGSKENLHECEFCGQPFIERTTLDAHIEEEHRSNECEECGKSFRDKGQLNIHNKIHPEKTPFKCEVCGKGFMKRLNLNRHHKLHTGEKQHKCEVCGKSFAEKHKLTFHKRTHTGEKPFKCEVCDKGFTLKEQLNIHRSVHTGEKPYKCATCDKSFSGPSSLSKHRKTHTGDKPHKCETCDKCFPIKAQLTIHTRSHTGEKPYKCRTCDKCFVSKSNLNVHLRIHTGQKPFQCEICNRCFTQRAQMIQHKKIHNVEN